MSRNLTGTALSRGFDRALPDHPTPDVWWQILERNEVNRLWISPTGVRALVKYGDDYPKKYDLSSVKLVVCAGEVLNPPVWEWLKKRVFQDRIPVIDHMWQTETGGPIVGNPLESHSCRLSLAQQLSLFPELMPT